MDEMNGAGVRRCAAAAAALADPGRLRILAALRGRSLCFCHLVALLGLAPSTVSRHIAVLRRAGLVETRRRGRWVHVRLAGGDAPAAARAAARWALRSTAADPRVRADAARLGRLLRTNPSALCERVFRR